jgi:hypothetical protein
MRCLGPVLSKPFLLMLLAAVTVVRWLQNCVFLCAGDSEELCEDILSYMASHPSVAKFAVPDDCVVVQVSAHLHSTE